MAIRIYVLFLVWQYNRAKFTSFSLRFLFNSLSLHFLESILFIIIIHFVFTSLPGRSLYSLSVHFHFPTKRSELRVVTTLEKSAVCSLSQDSSRRHCVFVSMLKLGHIIWLLPLMAVCWYVFITVPHREAAHTEERRDSRLRLRESMTRGV